MTKPLGHKSHQVGRCAHCGTMTYGHGTPEVRINPGCKATRDHIIPRATGLNAPGRPHATVLACEDCNQIRGDAPVDVFRFWLRKNTTGTGARKARMQAFRQFRLALEMCGFNAVTSDARRRSQPAVPPKDMGDILRRFTAL